MQRCLKCSKEFSYKAVFKSLLGWKSYAPIKCDSCNTIHSCKSSTGRIVTAVLIISMLLNIPLKRYIGNYSILVYLLSYPLLIIVLPFFAKYYIKDEIDKLY